ncbi:MAG: glycosyltransferase family A protein, partial [Candidatus Neomarinimicrobiota bacterium]
MEKEQKKFSVSVIVHLTDTLPYDMKGFANVLNSVVNQSTLPAELIVIDERKAEKSQFEIGSVPTTVIRGNFQNQSEKLNRAIKKCTSNYVLYIDNSVSEIRLKRSYIDTAMLIVEKYPALGMLYADYDLLKDETRQEIRLLKHHAGRLRDNQDFGKVFFFSKEALKSVKLFDESLTYRSL